MSLSIPQRFITNLEDFTWGKDWRATRIIKEKRVDGEYYFANILRYYGEKEDTHDHDVSETHAESAWLGRNEKFVGKRIHDTDPDSKTFGKRIYSEAITETITEKDSKGRPVEREVLIDGKTIYEYIIPATKENTEKIKTLAGAIALNQETIFLFVYGANPPLIVDPDTFFNVKISDYLNDINPLKKDKKDGKKI
jgi:hypothetical protein